MPITWAPYNTHDPSVKKAIIFIATAPIYSELDFNGKDLIEEEGQGSLVPYKFANHGGWQGTSHPSVFKDENKYYLAHRGRLAKVKYFMVLHVRKIFWAEDGWPVVHLKHLLAWNKRPLQKKNSRSAGENKP